jgi:hypothetical protein
MFKRLFWLVVGVGFGVGMSVWLMRFIKGTVERYSPDRVSADLSSALRQLGTDIADAVAEGRQGMHEAEAELREKLRPGAEL